MPDPQTILVVEDEPELAEMLAEYLRTQGYRIFTVGWGEDAVKLCQETPPDLVLLDIQLPDINGYEVARRLQAHHRAKNSPVIFLTQRHDRADRLQGLELGAVDYITKPYDLQELHLRVRNALLRSTQETLVNPTTGLPEGRLINERLAELLPQANWTIILINLRRMNRFREAYGFVAADDVMRAVALMLKEAIRHSGNETDTVGHLTTENFVIVSTQDRAEAVLAEVREKLSRSIDYFYPLIDHAAGAIPSERLMFATGLLKAAPYENVDALKQALMRSLPN